MTPSKNQAIQTALLGDWQNATAINKALLNSDPNDIESLNRLAFALTVLGKVRRAKLYYLREKVGKESKRLKEKVSKTKAEKAEKPPTKS